MAHPKLCIGVDIGASSIKLCQLRRTSDGLAVERFGIAPLPAQTVVEGSLMNAQAATSALVELLGEAPPKGARVALAISGTAVIIKKVVLPQMSRDELEESIAFEAEQLIPYALSDVYLDAQILGPLATQPGQMEVLLVVAKKDFVNDYTQVVREAGLEPAICDVDAFALETCFLANYEAPLGPCALVNVGASKININVLCGGQSVFTRDVTLGGQAINQAIVQRMRVSFDEAESLKLSQLREPGQNPALAAVDDAIDNVVHDLAAEIQHSLDFFAASSPQGACESVFLAGGSGQLMPLKAALAERLGVPVEFLNPFKKTAPGDIPPQALDEVASRAAVAVGLAMRYIGDAP